VPIEQKMTIELNAYQ